MNATATSTIEHADAVDWLAAIEPGTAAAVIFDPPYAVGTPVRGREDGAAGSVFGPLSFLSRTMSLCARTLRPGGIVLIFTDWRRLPDMGYIASTVGLRPATCVAWVRNRPGTGGLLRASWDPVLVAARGVPDAVDRAAIRNVVVADIRPSAPTRMRSPQRSTGTSSPASAVPAIWSWIRSLARARPVTPRGSWTWSGAGATSTRSSPRRARSPGRPETRMRPEVSGEHGL